MSSSSTSSSSSSSSSKSTFTATIPSSQDNPFINTTSLPEGTLFIAVGSILLGIIVLLLVWRIYAIWASYRAATYNEARFTALEPSYGGPFVDPVAAERESEEEENFEKGPVAHPVGVPLNPNSKTRARKQRPKSQVERLKEAHLQGKFFSPTADVLMHGNNNNIETSLTGATQGNPYGASYPHSSRLSVLHSGRNSVVQQAAMSSTDLQQTSQQPQGPPEGTANAPGATRPRKIRPPSAYLDDLIG